MDSNDNRDWDDIMEDEDNPFDNPDDTFLGEENAYKKGYKLGFNDIENNGCTDLETDIDYPSYATEEIIKQFKQGYHDGASDAVDKIYGDIEENGDNEDDCTEAEDFEEE